MRRIIVGIATLIAMVGISAGQAVAAPPKDTSPGPPTGVTIRPLNPDRACSGDQATLSWTPPAATGGSPITGYHVQFYDNWFDPPIGQHYDVGADVTSINVSLQIGDTAALVWPETAAGQGSTPGIATIVAGAAPQRVEFWNGSVVADHTVALNMGWSPEEKGFGPGGSLSDVTITLTRSDGHKLSYTPTSDIQQTVFDNLSDRNEYSWTSSATNQCGTTEGYDTPGFRAGVAPAFTRDTPLLSVTAGRPYHYRFHATGKLKPTYALTDAPAWLSIDSTTGALSGTPPVGTTQFVYSVTATNQVGEDFGNGARSITTAGPFTVAVVPKATTRR